jgi:hypothetical protein
MTSTPTGADDAEQPRTMSGFRPARRRTQRLLMPTLRFLIEGRALASVDWSLGGLQVGPYVGTLHPGEEFSIGAVGPADGPLMAVGIRARVLRIEDDALAAVFVELDGRAFDTLEAMMLRRRQYLASLAATARAVA